MSNRYRITKSGIILGPTREIRAAGRGHKVRNVETQKVLPCNWSDCWNDGDDRIRIETPHQQPQWPGQKLIYIFCSDDHRRYFAQGTRYEKYLP